MKDLNYAANTAYYLVHISRDLFYRSIVIAHYALLAIVTCRLEKTTRGATTRCQEGRNMLQCEYSTKQAQTTIGNGWR